jgi:hypothetical protein
MIRTARLFLGDLLHFVALTYSSHTSVVAENLCLPKSPFLLRQLMLRAATDTLSL